MYRWHEINFIQCAAPKQELLNRQVRCGIGSMAENGLIYVMRWKNAVDTGQCDKNGGS
jgi:hypothetical protein